MANILIRGADVLTLDDPEPFLHGADIAIAGPLIRAIGVAPSDFVPDEVVEGRGHIVAPGLFNGHTHSGAVLRRGVASADGIYVPSDGETAYWAAQLALIEMIRSGVVGFADHYFFMDRVAAAVADSGMRAVLSWCTYGGAVPGAMTDDGSDGVIGGDLAAVAAFAEAWNGAAEGRIHTALGPHSAGRCSPMFLARSAAVAARLGVGIHVHVAATPEEVDAVQAEYGMTPVELLDKNGVFDVPVTAVHAIHLTPIDIELLAERGAAVVYCPSIHIHQGLGRTPVALLAAAGVPLALGTGGADVAYTLNMFQAVRDATLPYRNIDPSPAQRLDLLTAFRFATRSGAAVLGFPASGRLTAEYSADLVMIDTRRAHLMPLINPLAALAHAVGPSDVSDVMVGGRWLLRGGELQTIDEARVLWQIGKAAAA